MSNREIGHSVPKFSGETAC